MIKFGAPGILLWLWALVPLAWVVLALARRRERLLARLVDPAVLPVHVKGRNPVRVRNRHLIWLLAIALCLFALARPQWGFHWQEVKRRGLDIMVVLDTSRSMLAEDIKPNRLQQAKWGIRDLAKILHGDRVGLVSFAGSSFLQCPLTSDYAAFLMTLDDVYVGIIPRGGTDLPQALNQAINSFEKRADADRAIILVTDGEDHAGNLDPTLKRLKKEGILVYAVGVGTLEGDLIPQQNEEGHATFFKNREGNVVKSALQESELETLAVDTGGMYVRSAPGDFGLDRIVEQGLSQLKRSEHEAKMVKAYEDRFPWFLGAALLLLLLEAITRDRPRQKAAP